MTNLSEIQKKEGVIIRRLENDYYIFNEGKCYKVNETGALVYKYIGKDMQLSEFCKKMAIKYNSDCCDDIMKDVITFIEFLCSVNVIDIQNEGI